MEQFQIPRIFHFCQRGDRLRIELTVVRLVDTITKLFLCKIRQQKLHHFICGLSIIHLCKLVQRFIKRRQRLGHKQTTVRCKTFQNCFRCRHALFISSRTSIQNFHASSGFCCSCTASFLFSVRFAQFYHRFSDRTIPFPIFCLYPKNSCPPYANNLTRCVSNQRIFFSFAAFRAAKYSAPFDKSIPSSASSTACFVSSLIETVSIVPFFTGEN